MNFYKIFQIKGLKSESARPLNNGSTLNRSNQNEIVVEMIM